MMGDKKRMAAEILGPAEGEKEEEKGPDALHALAEEAIEAFHDRDAQGVVSAMRAMFQEFDSEPHVEGPHE